MIADEALSQVKFYILWSVLSKNGTLLSGDDIEPKKLFFPTDVSVHPPKPFVVEDLEAAINGAFKKRGKKINPLFFDSTSHLYPSNLSYLVLGFEQDNGYPGDILTGIISNKESIGGYEFDYWNTVFTVQAYQKRGLMSRAFKVAQEIKDENGKRPIIWKTEEPKNHLIYRRKSDIWIKIGNQYVYGIGFIDKETNRELNPGAIMRFYQIAQYVAFKPSKFLSL